MGSAQSTADHTAQRHVDEHGHQNGKSKEGTSTSSHLSNEIADHSDDSADAAATQIEYHDPRRPDGGMPLVHYQCRKKKKSYDKCVKQWYSTDFLSGSGASLNQDEVCGDKFEVYRACILKGIKREVWDKQNLPPPLEGSPLAEVVDDNDEKE